MQFHFWHKVKILCYFIVLKEKEIKKFVTSRTSVFFNGRATCLLRLKVANTKSIYANR